MPFTLAILAVTLSYTWFLAPRLPSDAEAVPIAIIIALALWHDVRVRKWGFDWRALLPGLGAAALFTIPLCGILVAAGAASGTLHDRGDFPGALAVLVLWGGAQQWILQTVILPEAQRAAGRRGGVAVAALLFASVHLPNPMLSTLTLVGALGWCTIYDRYPNLVPLALSHALGTLAVLYAFDDRMTGGLRVGLAFLARRP